MPLYEFEGKKPEIAETAFVFPTAIVIGNVKIGENCFIAPNAVLRGDWGYIEIGDGSNVQDTCVFHSIPDGETILGKNCHIGHGAVVHQATLGEHVLVGINAVNSRRRRTCAGMSGYRDRILQGKTAVR